MQQECVTQECKDKNCKKIIMQEWGSTGALVPVCSVYVKPSVWWRRGGCPIVHEYVEFSSKKRVGQQKQKRKK